MENLAQRLKQMEPTIELLALLVSVAAIVVSCKLGSDSLDIAKASNKIAERSENSAAAALKAAQQANDETRSQNERSTRPILDFAYKIGGTPEKKGYVVLRNIGEGAAIVISARGQHDGKDIQPSPKELTAKALFNLAQDAHVGNGVSAQSIKENQQIGKGSEIGIYELTFVPDDKPRKDFFSKLWMCVVYQSALNASSPRQTAEFVYEFPYDDKTKRERKPIDHPKCKA